MVNVQANSTFAGVRSTFFLHSYSVPAVYFARTSRTSSLEVERAILVKRLAALRTYFSKRESHAIHLKWYSAYYLV